MTPAAFLRRPVRAALLGLFALLAFALRAAPSGSLRAIVTDSVSHAYLAGAQLSLAPGGVTAVAGADGTFQVADLPAGAYSATVTYVGYTAQTQPVTVNAGETATLAFPLSSEVIQLGAFVVEGAVAGQARAINQQAAATGNLAVIASDAIGNFPDQNAAQALQRVSGVSVQQLYGQATTVSIRGAGSDMNTTTLDGVPMMGNRAIGSTGSNLTDGRSVSLNDFPAQILSSVTVVKTATPDLDANAIGGTVQLKTKSAFDFSEPVITANAGFQYSSQSKKAGPMFGVAAITQLGSWGLAVTGSYERRQGLEEQIEVKSEGTETYTLAGQSYTGYTMLQPELGNYDYDEHRTAASFALEKKFGDTLHLFVRGTRTVFLQHSGRPSLDLIDPTAAASLSAAGPVSVSNGAFQQATLTGVTVQRSTNPRTVADASSNLSAGGDATIGDVKLNLTANYNRGTGEVDARGSQWQAATKATVAYNYASPFFPQYTVLGGPNINDPTQFTLSQFKANETLEGTHQYTVKGDAERPFDLGGSRLTIKAGASVRWTEMDNTKLAPTYTPAAGQAFTLVNSAYPLLGDANPDFLSRYDLGPSVAPFPFANFAQANPSLFTLNAAKTLSTDLAGDDTLHENLAAAFAMGTWTSGPWTVIAGVRGESTGDRSQGFLIPPTATATPSSYPLVYYRHDYSQVDPDVLVRFEPTKRVVVRASWTNTLARPDLNTLAPTQNVTFQTNPTAANPDTVSGGNPGLKATTATNWDASVDYYFSSLGLVSAGVFYKDIRDPVYPSIFAGTYQGDPALFTSYANAGKAWIRGFEAEYQQQLSFLPAPLDGFGLYANLTLVNSSVHVPEEPGQAFTFFNQANKVANLGLSYARGGFYGRVAYNWTGSYLISIDGVGLNEYQAPYHSLDLIFTQRLGRHWTIKFTANNLTKFPTREYFNTPAFLDVYAQDGRFFTAGVNWAY